MNSCARVTVDHEVSEKVSAKESKALADATEPSAVKGHAYSLFQMSPFPGVHTTVDLEGFEAVTLVTRLEEHSVAARMLARIRLPR